MGFDAWFFARIDFQERDVRMQEKTMQWVWKPFSESLGDEVSIFTHVMADHYHQPETFRVDELLPWIETINTDRNSEGFNADEMIEELRVYILDAATHYRTNQLMIPWGDDFFWADAALSYKNMEDVIEFWSSKYSDITLI